MGEYVYVGLKIHGLIATVAGARTMIEQIESELGDDTVGDAILEAVKAGDAFAFFECSDVNYGNIDGIKAACVEHAIPFEASYGGSREFMPGIYSFHVGDEDSDQCDSDDEHPVIPLAELEACFKGDDVEPAYALALIRRYRKLSGAGLPPLAISAEVRAFLEGDREV